MIFITTAVIILAILVIFQLVTGVANDAVNFLNSAFGSKVASRKTIMWIAGGGLIIGTFFSGGMMEVARSGVIHPEKFYLHELLTIFLAAGIVSVLIWDAYNTIGFPTSTTITIITSLIGGSLAIYILRGETGNYSDYINTGRIFLIFAGILLSIILAFVTGSLVQFITRIIFTFEYRNKYHFLFALAGALSFTSLIFLILKKGIGGIFTDYDYNQILVNNLGNWLFISFIVSFLVLWGLGVLVKLDIPRLVVFFGTFALALSFAANDLVNFTGLPLTGIESYKAFLNTPGASPKLFALDFLNNEWLRNQKFNDVVYLAFYVISGIVMVLTILYSKKSRTVTDTEIYLGRQSAGKEHFEPSQLSRLLVRNFLFAYEKVSSFTPKRVHRLVTSRYTKKNTDETSTEIIYFDTVRAAVNLVIASVLISIGTYLRYPLSTTFVAFMVVMGTSFADQAWGRESAVYRLSGVLSVLGGWFVTTIGALGGTFILTLIIAAGGWIAAIVLFLLMVFVLYKTTIYHKTQQQKKEALLASYNQQKNNSLNRLQTDDHQRIRKAILEISKIYFLIINGLIHEDIQQVREAREKAIRLYESIKDFKNEVFRNLATLPEEIQDSSFLFVQALDYLSELTNCLHQLVPAICNHVENRHKGLTEAQQQSLQSILDEMTAYFNYQVHLEKDKRFSEISDLKQKQSTLKVMLEEIRIEHIRRIRSGEGKTRINVIYMEILGETHNLLLYGFNLFQSLSEFNKQSRRPVQ